MGLTDTTGFIYTNVLEATTNCDCDLVSQNINNSYISSTRIKSEDKWPFCKMCHQFTIPDSTCGHRRTLRAWRRIQNSPSQGVIYRRREICGDVKCAGHLNYTSITWDARLALSPWLFIQVRGAFKNMMYYYSLRSCVGFIMDRWNYRARRSGNGCALCFLWARVHLHIDVFF